MANFDDCLIVDKAVYSNFHLVMTTINTTTLGSIKTCKEVLSELPGTSQEIFINKPDVLFIGILTKICQHNGQITGFKLDEVSQTGIRTGQVFHVLIPIDLSNSWIENPSIKSAKPNEKFLFFLENIPFKVNNENSNEIMFSVISSTPGEANILLKQFSDSVQQVYLHNRQCETLVHTASTVEPYTVCSVYGVITRIIKEPKITVRNTAHGMILITDPSCYQSGSLTGRTEFCVSVFLASMSVYPSLNIGDVLKLENIIVRRNAKGWLEREFLVRTYTDNQFVLFPDGDWEEPICPDDRFYLTEEDIKAVENLKKWYANVVSNSAIPSMSDDNRQQSQQIPCSMVKNEVATVLPSNESGAASTSQVNHTNTDDGISHSQKDRLNLDCARDNCSSQIPSSDLSVRAEQCIDELKAILPTLESMQQQRITLVLENLIEAASQSVSAHSSTIPTLNEMSQTTEELIPTSMAQPTVKEEFVPMDESPGEMQHNGEASTSQPFVAVKEEITEESSDTFNESKPEVFQDSVLESPTPSSSNESIEIEQSSKNALEADDSIQQVSCKKIKLEPMESNTAFVIEKFEFSRASQ